MKNIKRGRRSVVAVSKKIYNPVTGKWYVLVRREHMQKPGTFKGLWKKPKKRSSLLKIILGRGGGE